MELTGRATIVAGLAVALAVLASAAGSHAVIGWLGVEAGSADAYVHRAHGTAVPVVLAATFLLCSAMLRIAAGAVTARRDVVVLVARHLGRRDPRVPAALVATGTLVVLTAMEFIEQLAADGHIEGLSDALGGNLALGLAVVVTTAVAVTVVGLRFLRALAETALAVSLLLHAWLSPCRRSCSAPLLSGARHPSRGNRARPGARFASCFGLRAPPSTRSSILLSC